MMKSYVIIVAGGIGKRMQTAVPKQFMELAGKPILMHTIEKFVQFDSTMKIIVVLPEQHRQTWEELKHDFRFNRPHLLVNGGMERFYSVKNGLDQVTSDGIVAIHDGVRPLVSNETIKRCFAGAEKYGNAIPCLPVTETIRRITENGSVMEDRSVYRVIQTPQVFKIDLIKKAYEQPFSTKFTDDASVVEYFGQKIHLVEGNKENIKITEPSDLIAAEGFFR